jgi:DNA repair protein RadC
MTARLCLVREHVPDWTDAARYDGRPLLDRPAAVARWLHLKHATEPQEVLGCLYLDTRHRLLEHVEHFRGGYDRAAVDPRPILCAGLLSGCGSFLVYHTHPSGDPNPSAEDLAITRRLDEGARAIGMTLADHLIIGNRGRFCSLRERGGW